MKKTFLLALAIFQLLTFNFQLFAQSDPVIIEVAGQKIHVSEFMNEFNNNVGRQLNAKADVSIAEKQAALEEYVELYATFRAKEQDALMNGFDTMPRLINELNHYRRELAAPYLIDSAMLHQLFAEAYERNQYSNHAAHILVPVRPDAAPEDTMKAYQHALEVRERLLKGEDFYTVASEELHNFNPQAPYRPNEGDLGYFTVFDMVYPFENAVYALQVGELSMPVRTQYGYHIVKLIDRVKGLTGEITMAHIWLSSPDSLRRLSNINDIYNKLQKGATFEEMARLSDDASTAEKGGLLADATLSQLPPEYIHKLIDMKPGEISKPFFTQYGWHIIKLIKRDTLPPLEKLEGLYKQRMSRDQRGNESRKTFAANSRRRYGIIDCTTTPVPQSKGKKKAPAKMMASLNDMINHLNDSIYLGIWQFKDEDFTDTTPLVITPERRYTTLDLARHIRKSQRKGLWLSYSFFTQSIYSDFLDSVSIVYADSQLEKEHPDFAEIVNEYRRGLMIFNYNDQMIWSKALQDTAGLRAFYAQVSPTKRLENPEDSIFFFHPRARVTVLDITNENALPQDKAKKIIDKAYKKNLGSSAMRQELLKKIDRKKYPDDGLVKADVELVEQTRQTLLTNDQWQEGVYTVSRPLGYRILVVEQILPRSLKGLKESRGYYLNAWQNEVERRLNEELRTKYNVKIHRDVVHSLSF